MCSTWQAAAVVGGVALLHAGPSILARRGAAWHVRGLTVLASVLLRTAAVVRADLVHAHAAIQTWGGSLSALVDVLFTGLTMESRGAGADEGGIEG